MTLSVNIPIRGRKITNGDMIIALFFDIKVVYSKTKVDIFKLSDGSYLYSVSREWWDSIYEEKKYG